MDGDEQPLNLDSTRVPLTNIHRLMKKGIPSYGKASKDAKQAVQEVIQEFIGFVTSEAKSVCHNEKRKVLGGSDIVQALENLGMKRYSDILKEYQKGFRKSVAPEVPEESDGESEMVLETGENDNDPEITTCTNQGEIEDPLNGLLSDSDALASIHESLGLPPIGSTSIFQSNDEQNCHSGLTLEHSADESNCNPSICAGSQDNSTSNAFVEEEPNEADVVNSVGPSDAYHNVTIDAWKIPTATISGIRIPEIDIPELTVPVELDSIYQPTERPGEQPSSPNAFVDPTIIENDTGIKTNFTLDDYRVAPDSDVIDLISPTSHIPLRLLDPHAFDPLDFDTFLGDKTPPPEGLSQIREDSSSPRAAAVQAALMSNQHSNEDPTS